MSSKIRSPDRAYGLPTTAAEDVHMSTARLDRIELAMRGYVERREVPGLLTAVARHGKIVHFAAQGYADVERQARLEPDTIFRIYSMTKPVTAAAVMVAYEEGRFFLDDPLAAYLPEFGALRVYQKGRLADLERPLTIRHLLTHTGGISYFFHEGDVVADEYRGAGLMFARARETLTTEEYIRKIAGLPLAFQPGTAWCYSESMDVLGRLLEVVCGGSYGHFLADRLFSPLGMSDSGFYVPAEKLPRLARLYEMGADGNLVASDTLPPADFIERTVEWNDFSMPPSFESGGAGLVGTAADYLRFAQMLLNGGELDGVRVLSPTSVKLMLANHLGPEFGSRPLASLAAPWAGKDGLGHGFGGLVVTDAVANGTAGSNGEYRWGGAASTDFWIDPKRGISAVVLTQVLPNGVALTTRARFHQMTYQAVLDD
ncbi:MAG: serine hydrolase domain-containing protein [Phenylobacterium sp.]|uniref:serine hydrolase domain-containing protein n=1 Tax=Phenylobacterium sp. TaxID=1871053 RepID=UPI0027374A79|nr:serine hydrolase domain-containing protein [Phenylobacterium sp.]MDP3746679.1 serine hydrolase domain-containing protein [Phenylobacterium sp.]